MPKSDPYQRPFRPPFHIPVSMLPQCRKMAHLCNKYFSIARSLEILMGKEAIRRSAMLCKDEGGWYVLGRPERFPLTFPELADCSPDTATALDDFMKQCGDGDEIHVVSLNDPLLSIEKEESWLVHLGKVGDIQQVDGNAIPCVAIFPMAEPAGRPDVAKLLSGMQNLPSLYYHRMDFLGDIVNHLPPVLSKSDFSLESSLNRIMEMLSERLNVRACATFIRDSIWAPPFDKGAATGEKLKMYGQAGYIKDSDKEIIYEIRPLGDNQPPPGITVSIVIDDFLNPKEKKGKIVIMNHRLEIGGYNPHDPAHLKDRDDACSKVIRAESDLRKGRLAPACIDQIKNAFGQNGDSNVWEKDIWWAGVPDYATGTTPCSSLLGVPIVVDGTTAGCIKVEGANLGKATRDGLYESGRFTFQDVLLLHCISGLVSNIIHTAKVRYDSRVSSRQKPVYNLTDIAEIYKNASDPLGVFFVDIDNFKAVNDQLGYHKANKILRSVAQIIVECSEEHAAKLETRTNVGRYGGDEFVVVFDRPLTKEECEDCELKLKRKLADTFTGDSLSVSASIGCSDNKGPDGGDSISLQECIELASIASKVAKHAGKNRLVYFNEIKELLSPDSGAKIVKMLSPKMAIINIGREHGVFKGMKFEVKFESDIGYGEEVLEKNFDLAKAQFKVDKEYAKISFGYIENSKSDVAEGDRVELMK